MHYQFTHQLLRRAILESNPAALRSMIQNRQFADFCFELVAHCFESDTDAAPNVDAIIFEAEMGIFDVLHEDDIQMVLISLPTPQAMTEAHYVLVALAETPRYFTLEATTNSLDYLDTSFGILCEWTVDGTHYNYGSCPLHPTKFIRNSLMKIRSLRAKVS